MFLSQHGKTELFKKFPNVELSYEDTVYKKVHGADLYIAIPNKNKCFVWFTYYQNNNVCFVASIINDKVTNIRSYPCCFNSPLSLGTVLYGSLVTTDKQLVFCAEDILQYKGQYIDKLPWNKRITHLSNFIQNTNPFAFSKNFLIISMPLFSKDYKELEVFIEHSVYDIEYIQARTLNSQTFLNCNINQINRHLRNSLPTAIFYVKPCIQADIYDLYCYSRGREFYDMANIPNFKTSKLMILILSKRIEQIDYISKELRKYGEDITCFKGNKQDYNKDARIMIATISKAGVGFDHPKMDTLILATDVEGYFIQYLGRVFRREDVHPIIFDIVDNFNSFTRHYYTRKKIYEDHGGKIIPFNSKKVCEHFKLDNSEFNNFFN